MNRQAKYLLLALLAAITGLVFVPQGFLEGLARTYFSSRPRNFLIQEVVGRVEKRSLSATRYESVESKDSLTSGDTVITHGDSKALFNFDTPFWLMPYSKMEFLRKDGLWTGHLVYGEFKKLPTLSSNEKIELIHDNKIIEQDQFSTAIDSTLIANVVPASSAGFKDIAIGSAPPQSVVEKQIFQTLLLHKKFFQSCLIKYYKESSGAITGGESVFDLTIDVTGAIEKAVVTKSDIGDQDYLDCVKVVFSRIRFKNLPIKEPLHALFPLSVELPQEN